PMLFFRGGNFRPGSTGKTGWIASLLRECLLITPATGIDQKRPGRTHRANTPACRQTRIALDRVAGTQTWLVGRHVNCKLVHQYSPGCGWHCLK
ncbi:MAG: hypothetical protein ACT6Q9_18950, partial [Polaromonas sp.]|uniref:hypothetical protein n=1 Tax=Polaromonas sp. TaxID=1869339 RepID=UPI00403571A0